MPPSHKLAWTMPSYNMLHQFILHYLLQHTMPSQHIPHQLTQHTMSSQHIPHLLQQHRISTQHIPHQLKQHTTSSQHIPTPHQPLQLTQLIQPTTNTIRRSGYLLNKTEKKRLSIKNKVHERWDLLYLIYYWNHLLSMKIEFRNFKIHNLFKPLIKVKIYF